MRPPAPTRLDRQTQNEIVQKLMANPNYTFDVVRSSADRRFADPKLIDGWLSVLEEIQQADDRVAPTWRDWIWVFVGVAVAATSLAVCDFSRLDIVNVLGSGAAILGGTARLS